MYVTVLLLFITIIVPVRLAFADEDPLGWKIVYNWIDLSFLIDIILTFFTSYTNHEGVEETDFRTIAKNYLSGWFAFDVFSIIPLDYILNNSDLQFNSLFRFAKITKIYKIVRLTRLAKAFKLLKKNKMMMSKFSEKLSLSAGLERLIIFSFFFGILLHVSTCMYILLAQLEEGAVNTWIETENADNDKTFNGFDLYVLSLYFHTTIMATVGFGDVSGTNLYERLYCILLMIIGVTAFTFVSGALSSILSTFDHQQASLQEKILHLNKLRQTISMSDALYSEIRSAMNFQADQQSELDYVLDDLPLSLKMELNMTVHLLVFKDFKMFTKVGDKQFINWLSS